MIRDGEDEFFAFALHFRPPDTASVMTTGRRISQGNAFRAGFDDVDLDDGWQHQRRQTRQIRHE